MAEEPKMKMLWTKDEVDAFMSNDEVEFTCGRWNNGRLGPNCSLAGTEDCEFECPYRARAQSEKR